MTNQTLQFSSPHDFADTISLHTSENQTRNVSYALVPKEVKVELSTSQILFNFKYPINEDNTLKKSFCNASIEFVLAERTKKILSVVLNFKRNEKTKLKLKDFNKSIRLLRTREYRESVKKNYDFALEFIHFFVKKDHNPEELDKLRIDIAK